MRNNKKDTISIVAFVAIALVAIIIKSNTLGKESTFEGTAMVPIKESEKSIDEDLFSNLPITEKDPIVDEAENTLLPIMPNRMTFGEAFSKAREENGPGSLFKWNDKTFTASYAEELVDEKNNSDDSVKVNMALNEITVDEK